MSHQVSTRWVRRLFLRAWVGAVALAPWMAYAQTDAKALTLAVVPQFQAADVHRNWTPVIERIKQVTGLNVVLRITKDIPTFEDEFQAGQADLVYLNPYHQVMAHRAQGYVPLVRDAQLLTGIVVVRKDDPIQSMAQLAGKEIAYPAPNAFGASLLVRSHLAEVDKVQTQPFYAKTHTNAYRQVIVGKSAAAGGVRATLEKEPEEVRAALRVLWETPGAAPHPLSAHPRVPAQQAQAIANAILKMAAEPQGQELLKAILMPQPVRADYARDYRPLEKLKLDKYVE
ncbi:MAG: phosphate/phosphite/phosphonate ABC transporter substrate-binding protein [Aquabacterium sp.]